MLIRQLENLIKKYSLFFFWRCSTQAYYYTCLHYYVLLNFDKLINKTSYNLYTYLNLNFNTCVAQQNLYIECNISNIFEKKVY